MNNNSEKLKYPQRTSEIKTTEPPPHEAKTEGIDTFKEELKFINHYLSCGHAKGRAHSKAAILDGKPGYFFVTSVDVGNGNRRECIMFATLVNRHILLTNFD